MANIFDRGADAAVLRGSIPQDYDDRLSRYVRLARLMQQKIRTGVWKPGTQIPTLPELCSEFNLSRPCVRQAIALLIKDGMVTAFRGRGTFVTERLTSILDDDSLRVSISDPLAMGAAQSIKVHGRTEIDLLPPEMATTEPQDPPYIAIEKTHGYSNQPFALARIYVARRLYEQLPEGLDETHKIVPLLRDYTGVRPIRYRQEITIMHATADLADRLNLPIASSIVQIRRWWTDETGRIGWASLGRYRSDMFVLDVTIEDAAGNLLSLISPGARAAPGSASLHTARSRPRV